MVIFPLTTERKLSDYYILKPVSTNLVLNFATSIVNFFPCGTQISEIVGRFERKGYKLVAIKLIVPTKEFAAQHYDDLKERPFFNGLCDFLSSGPVVAMVCIQNLQGFIHLLSL